MTMTKPGVSVAPPEQVSRTARAFHRTRASLQGEHPTAADLDRKLRSHEAATVALHHAVIAWIDAEQAALGEAK